MAAVEITFLDTEGKQLAIYALPVTPGGPQIQVMVDGFTNFKNPPKSFTVKLRAESGDDLTKGRITALENKVNRFFQNLEDFLNREEI